jgi:hypothetical protein
MQEQKMKLLAPSKKRESEARSHGDDSSVRTCSLCEPKGSTQQSLHIALKSFNKCSVCVHDY